MNPEVPKIALVGTVSNVEKCIVSELSQVCGSFPSNSIVKIILVESDSKDSTLKKLEELRRSYSNLSVISLGELREIIPNRIERIRYCRNIYVSELRVSGLLDLVDYVVVADLDGMNSRVTAKGVSSSFTLSDWDVVTANQKFGYYDLLALRHADWCPNDVMLHLRNLQLDLQSQLENSNKKSSRMEIRLAFDQLRKMAIYSKMKVLKKDHPWIEVDSAFGGLAIYKKWIFKNIDYSILPKGDMNECEHVALSFKIRENGGKIFINPRMINNNFNTYNINRIFLIRQMRDLYWNSKFLKSIKNTWQKGLDSIRRS